MCKVIDMAAQQRWRCEEAYRIAKLLNRTDQLSELKQEFNGPFAFHPDLEFIKFDNEMDPPQTRWWLGAARQSAKRLYKERKYV